MTTNTDRNYPQLKLAVSLEYFGNRLGNAKEHQSNPITLVRQDLQTLGIPHPKGNKLMYPTPNSVQFYWMSKQGSTLHKKLLEKIRQNAPSRETLNSLSISAVTLHELYASLEDNPFAECLSHQYGKYSDDKQDNQPTLHSSNFPPQPSALSAPTHQQNQNHQRKLTSGNSNKLRTNGSWQAQKGKMKAEQQSPHGGLFPQPAASLPSVPSSSISTLMRRSPPPHQWPPSRPDPYRSDHPPAIPDQHLHAYRPYSPTFEELWSGDGFPPPSASHGPQGPQEHSYSHGHPPPLGPYDHSHPRPHSEQWPPGQSEPRLGPGLQSRLSEPHHPPRSASISSNHSHGRNVWPPDQERGPPPHTAPPFGIYHPVSGPTGNYTLPPSTGSFGQSGHELPPPLFSAPITTSQLGAGSSRAYDQRSDFCARIPPRTSGEQPPFGQGPAPPLAPRGHSAPRGPRRGENGLPLGPRADVHGSDRLRKRSFPEDDMNHPFSSNERYHDAGPSVGDGGWAMRNNEGNISANGAGAGEVKGDGTRRGQKRQRVRKDSSKAILPANGSAIRLSLGAPVPVTHPLPPNPLESVNSVPPSASMRSWGATKEEPATPVLGKNSGSPVGGMDNGNAPYGTPAQDSMPFTESHLQTTTLLSRIQSSPAASIPHDQAQGQPPAPEREDSYENDSPSVPMFGVGTYTPAPHSIQTGEAPPSHAGSGKELSALLKPASLPDKPLGSRVNASSSTVSARSAAACAPNSQSAAVTSSVSTERSSVVPPCDDPTAPTSLGNQPPFSTEFSATPAAVKREFKAEEPLTPVITLSASSSGAMDVDSAPSRPDVDTGAKDSGSLASSRAVSAAPPHAPIVDFRIPDSPPSFKLSPASWPPASVPQSERERSPPASRVPVTTPAIHTPLRMSTHPDSPLATSGITPADAEDSAEVQRSLRPDRDDEAEVDTDVEQGPDAEVETQGPPRLRIHRNMTASASSSNLTAAHTGESPSGALPHTNDIHHPDIDPSVVENLRAELAAALLKSEAADKALMSIKEEVAAERKRRGESEKRAVDARKRVGEVNGHLEDERKKSAEVQRQLELEQKRRAEAEGAVESAQQRAVDAEKAKAVAEETAAEAVRAHGYAERSQGEAERAKAKTEKLLADVRRECTAPFVVPGLYDAYVALWGVREQTGEGGQPHQVDPSSTRAEDGEVV